MVAHAAMENNESWLAGWLAAAGLSTHCNMHQVLASTIYRCQRYLKQFCFSLRFLQLLGNCLLGARLKWLQYFMYLLVCEYVCVYGGLFFICACCTFFSISYTYAPSQLWVIIFQQQRWHPLLATLSLFHLVAIFCRLFYAFGLNFHY